MISLARPLPDATPPFWTTQEIEPWSVVLQPETTTVGADFVEKATRCSSNGMIWKIIGDTASATSAVARPSGGERARRARGACVLDPGVYCSRLGQVHVRSTPFLMQVESARKDVRGQKLNANGKSVTIDQARELPQVDVGTSVIG